MPTYPSSTWTDLIKRNAGDTILASDINFVNGNTRYLKDYLISTDVQISNTKFATGAIGLNYYGTGDRVTSLDFHSDDTVAQQDTRLHRDSGVDGDFSIYNYGTGKINFYVNSSTNAMTITNDGNVNIGGSTTSDKLTVTSSGSDVKIGITDGTVYGWGGYIINSTSTFISGTFGAHVYQLYTNNNPRMTILSSGNIGIGTTAPVGKLQVNGTFDASYDITNGHNDGIVIRDNVGASFNGGNIVFGAASGVFAGIKSALIDGGGNTIGDLTLCTRTLTTDASISAKMIIKSSGNIGIGNVNPQRKLHVSDTAAPPVRLECTTAAAGTYNTTAVEVPIDINGTTYYLKAYTTP